MLVRWTCRAFSGVRPRRAYDVRMPRKSVMTAAWNSTCLHALGVRPHADHRRLAVRQRAAQGLPGRVPPALGHQLLYIQAKDNAGNLSQLATYAFYVPWNPNGPAPVFGDTTGDGSADIVTPGDDGNLYAHTGPGNTQATSPATALAARVANTPDGDSWAGYRTTHRGSLRGGLNVDDLIVHKDGAAQLYFYYNPGNTGTDGRFDKRAALTKPACEDDGSGTYCAGYAADWSTTTRIAALGDVSTTALDAGTFRDRARLLAEEAAASGDAALWFYPTVSDGQLGAPVRLAASGWKDLEPIAPGDWNHSGHPGLWARNHTTGDITAYTFTTGTTPVGGTRAGRGASHVHAERTAVRIGGAVGPDGRPCAVRLRQPHGPGDHTAHQPARHRPGPDDHHDHRSRRMPVRPAHGPGERQERLPHAEGEVDQEEWRGLSGIHRPEPRQHHLATARRLTFPARRHDGQHSERPLTAAGAVPPSTP
ncbi:hypothetical protein [Streptomyces violascens]|uniref:hypothetical protein n=1 Tax=Streptomyces violascens TaxID=67381 RepID=UPI0036B8CAAA